MNLPRDFIAVDLETTGLDVENCEIIEVAMVEVRDFKVVDRFSTLVKPEYPIPPFITMLTGIDDAMVADAPRIGDVIGSVADRLDDTTIVGHNVCFDSRFLKWAMDDEGLYCHYKMVDTLRMSRHVFKDIESHQLDYVAYACKARVESDERHRALYDAELAALCAMSMWPKVCELYGDDPDAELEKRSRNGGIPSLSDMKPTVDAIDESNPFYGTTVLFTGKMSGMTRAEAAQKAVNLGAIPVRSFTKKVDYLIVGSFDFVSNIKGEKSSKMKKAEKAIEGGSNLQIVSESFFADFASEV